MLYHTRGAHPTVPAVPFRSGVSDLGHGADRALCNMAAVAMRNAEAFELGERGCEKFRNMVEIMEATSIKHLGVSIASHFAYQHL